MARQEKRRHEVSVEKPLIRDECARQERNSNGCDGCLYYYSHPERFPAPVKHQDISSNAHLDISVSRAMADHAQQSAVHHPITARSPFLKRTAATSERFEATFSTYV